MAINKNHEFEDLEGTKCAIVEKNTSAERMQFLKDLLSHNGYQVVVTENLPPKPAPGAVAASGTETTTEASTTASEVSASAIAAAPTTYTIGVTDLTFNPTNAVFGRILKTMDGHIVTLAYWKQKAAVSDDATPYFDQH
jgi:hypothetical protein